MASIGSKQWCDEELARGANLAERVGCDARLSFTASGGPDGDVSWHVRIEAGRLTGVAPGLDADAQAVATLAWADAEAVFAGKLDANTAYMRGHLKASGETGPLLNWLALMQQAQRSA